MATFTLTTREGIAEARDAIFNALIIHIQDGVKEAYIPDPTPAIGLINDAEYTIDRKEKNAT